MYFLVLFLYYFVGGTKTAEPVPPCTAARRGNYGMRAHSTFGQERTGCLRLVKRSVYYWLRQSFSRFPSADTPPVPVRL